MDGVDKFPSLLDLVAAGEECGIAAHGIEQKAFVGLGRGFSKAGAVVEIHFDRFDTQAGARHLGAHAKGNALVRLNADHENIVINRLTGGAEENRRHAFEMNGYFGAGFRQAFSDADEKRDARPAPVVHIEFHGDIGLGDGLGIHIELVAVGGNAFAIDRTGTVLGADDMLENIITRERAQRAEHLHLLVADRVGIKAGGWLHGGEAEELEKVVLHHVAEGAGFFVVAGAAFHAERFAGGDLDVVDVAGVPHRFEEGIGEAEDDDVLRGLLAEVVVDAEGLGFIEGIFDEIV